MNLFMTVFVALLFVALTPGVLVSLPPGGSKLTVALFHGVVFALVYHLTRKAVWRMAFDKFTYDPKFDLNNYKAGGRRRMEAFRSR